MSVIHALENSDISWQFEGSSALDRYHRHPRGANLYIAVEAEIIDLAKIVDGLTFLGLDRWDAVVYDDDATLYFTCVDSPWLYDRSAFSVLSLSYNAQAEMYRDPYDAYQELRAGRIEPRNVLISSDRDAMQLVIDAAVLTARYGYEIELPAEAAPRWRDGLVDAAEQRRIFVDILTGMHAAKGLELLDRAGFIATYWPILARMGTTDHTKDFHPEGDVWEHTLESLGQRKNIDMTIGMALLLHDVGKPESPRTRERAFDGHAEIGARAARRFLRDLDFEPEFIDRVAWLVRNHMLPGVVHKLPIRRVESVMGSPLFPLLLEVYRCDLASTFTGPEPYYRACKTYRGFLKNRSNPFRDVEGKKLFKLFVE